MKVSPSGGGTRFEDTWTSIDTVDGGLQMLNRGPGPKSTVHVEDAFSIRR